MAIVITSIDPVYEYCHCQLLAFSSAIPKLHVNPEAFGVGGDRVQDFRADAKLIKPLIQDCVGNLNNEPCRVWLTAHPKFIKTALTSCTYS